ncbi:MAG: hypothetical protein IPK13_01305 [Deltaproteobacteria bacterium]|nr:hypothetical protein [Deltaproteobacteria bacterium]
MKPAIAAIGPEGSREEFLDQLLDEAERALLDVESRADEPGRRVPLEDGEAPGVAEFQAAIAELADAFPGLMRDVEIIGDMVRNVGALHAVSEVEARPHLMQLLWLSLETFVRQYPSLELYEAVCRGREDEEGPTPSEIYAGYLRLLGVLRGALS